jgi:hypothetical protein
MYATNMYVLVTFVVGIYSIAVLFFLASAITTAIDH